MKLASFDNFKRQLDETPETQAHKDAVEMGLKYKGFGYWVDPQTNQITHKTVGGQLQPFSPSEHEAGDGSPETPAAALAGKTPQQQQNPQQQVMQTVVQGAPEPGKEQAPRGANWNPGPDGDDCVKDQEAPDALSFDTFVKKTNYYQWTAGPDGSNYTNLDAEELVDNKFNSYKEQYVSEQQIDMGNPTTAALGITPADKAQQLGLQSDGHGNYKNDQGETVARTVNGELVFYDGRPGGGAVSDGAGGQELVQHTPSWSDPTTGMLMVPPSRAETPEEQAAVPETTPATPPAGYEKFMNQRRQQAYKDAKAQELIDQEKEKVNQFYQQDQFLSMIKLRADQFLDQAEHPEEQKIASVMQDMLAQNSQRYALLMNTTPEDQKGKAAAGIYAKLMKDAEASLNENFDPGAMQQAGEDMVTPKSPLKNFANMAKKARENKAAQQQPQPAGLSQDRMDALTQRLDVMRADKSLKKGAGVNRLNLEDIQKFRKYIKEGPQNTMDEINDQDMDFALKYLKDKTGKKWTGFQNRLKAKGEPAQEAKNVARAKEVLRSYLSSGGQSAIDGSPLPFSDSELDHGVSLDNGGLDEADNWRWLPKRFNQFKSSLSDEDLLAALDKEEEFQNSPDFKIRSGEEQFTNSMRQNWRDRFETSGWENMNVADIREKKGTQGAQFLKALAEKAGVSHYKARPGNRESGRAAGGTSLSVKELQDRLIDQLGIPDTVDVENFDRGLFEVLQKMEDQRSELDSMKRARSKEKRAAKKKKS